MRQVKLYVACSLDGYIARLDDSLDWLFSPDEDGDGFGYDDFVASVDTLIMGRRTYDISVALGGPGYHEDRTTLVLSRSREGIADDGAIYTAEEPRLLVERLRANDGGDIWLMGGGQVVRAFLAASLVDEFDVFVHPILLGEGVPLFPAGFPETPLELRGSEVHPSGLLRLSYRRAAAEPDERGDPFGERATAVDPEEGEPVTGLLLGSRHPA